MVNVLINTSLILMVVFVQSPSGLAFDTLNVIFNIDDKCVILEECGQIGGILDLEARIYNENVIIDKDLTIEGAGPDQTIVDGGGEGRVFTIEGDVTVTLRNMTITNGAFDNGAGIYAYSGNIILENVIVTGNQAVTAGAGIYTHTGSITIRNSTISDNRVTVFSNDNKPADALGAGVYSYSGDVSIDGSLITGNSVSAESCGSVPANALGGGVYTHTGSVQIADSDFLGNATIATACSPEVETTASGDGLYTLAGTVEITGSVFDDPIATGDQGSTNADSESVLVEAVELPQPAVTLEVTALVTETPIPSDLPDAQVAVRWMDALLAAVQRERMSPPVASRVFAYTGVTLYESVLPMLPDNRSLSGQLHNLPELPQPENDLTYDWPLVASSALYTVSNGLFEGASPETLESFATLRQTIALEMGETVPVNVFNRSNEYGEQIGQAILNWAVLDNYASIRNLEYRIPEGDLSFWIPLEGQNPLEPYWGLVRTFALPLASFCSVPLDIPFSIDPNSAFYAQAEEVRATVANLTPEQVTTALFWADNPGESSTPPGHWVEIENQVVEQLGLNLGQAAEMYALTGIALGDAFISAWETKYRVQLIRPVSYIQTYIEPEWTTVVSTPPFPEYPSGHSVASGAASVVLTELLGNIALTDITHAELGMLPRSFPSFAAAAEEAALSRLYGGIHYRVGIENGLEQGECIGRNVIERIQLQN